VKVGDFCEMHAKPFVCNNDAGRRGRRLNRIQACFPVALRRTLVLKSIDMTR
jgi:hypothetical protein